LKINLQWLNDGMRRSPTQASAIGNISFSLVESRTFRASIGRIIEFFFFRSVGNFVELKAGPLVLAITVQGSMEGEGEVEKGEEWVPSRFDWWIDCGSSI